MFWAKARRVYRNVAADDPDVKRFQELSNQFQTDVYGGIGGAIQDMGHTWVAKKTAELNGYGRGHVLEIGFGAGRHSLFFKGDRTHYVASEFSDAHKDSSVWASMKGSVLRCDARRLPFQRRSFDVVISIYNLEHISDLDNVFREVSRVLKFNGRFLIALPCEGGFAWNLGRELTTRRFFQKKYSINYDKVIAFEHVWSYEEVESRLRESGLFEILTRRFFPTLIPFSSLNLIGCIECRCKNVAEYEKS